MQVVERVVAGNDAGEHLGSGRSSDDDGFVATVCKTSSYLHPRYLCMPTCPLDTLARPNGRQSNAGDGPERRLDLATVEIVAREREEQRG